ncbi:HERC2 [Symbiodinium necroappetens]|uniref:HERC2 protein n=1 Tax=Symbiodinium necroappetens TaxID=1628268 RepID=A0A812XZW9_9DINO|nr:HERC2 [Symbiodinium necroappetens]
MTVQDLIDRAQDELRVGIRWLICSTGSPLKCSDAMAAAGIQDGDILTAIARKAALYSSSRAFALVRVNGTVLTWGFLGGKRCSAPEDLRNVDKVEGAAEAFAALQADGSVLTWGSPQWAEGSCLQPDVQNAKEILATGGAFAAKIEDGSTVLWGAYMREELEALGFRSRLTDLQDLEATAHSMAARLADGTVFSWGRNELGLILQKELSEKATQMKATERAFAAVLSSGSVVTWGDADYSGDSEHVQEQLHDVRHLQSSAAAFAALRSDGTVVTWGHSRFGGNSADVQSQLRDVQLVQATADAFAVILGDGSVVTWGDASAGGNSQAVQEELKSVERIESTCAAFAALLVGGSVVTWGDTSCGGDCNTVKEQLQDVLLIRSTSFAFAALRRDGRVVTWGCPAAGGDSSSVSEELKDVNQFHPAHLAHRRARGLKRSRELGQKKSWDRSRSKPAALEKSKASGITEELNMAVAAFAARLREAFDEAGLDGQKCEFDEASGQMILHGDVTRVVPVGMLFAHFAACKDEEARNKLVTAVLEAFVDGRADAPHELRSCGDRLLPQLWPLSKPLARRGLDKSARVLCGCNGVL